MLYYFLQPFARDFIFFNLFRYITFRTGGALLTSLVICFLLGPRIIRWLRAKQGEGQPMRRRPRNAHEEKGHADDGRLDDLIAVIVSTFLGRYLKHLFVGRVDGDRGFGMIGFADDYKKLTRRSAYGGVPGKIRLLLQTFLAIAAVLVIVSYSNNAQATALAVPFFKDIMPQLGAFFIVFAAFVIVGAANAVNLTDGLDGLATVPVMLVALCFGFITYLVGNAVFSSYLQIHHVPGSGELAVFCGALVGACLGFLWFNAPPAQVFMGDTGSLALGSAIGTIAVIIKHEIVLAIIGGLFVVETVSVIAQVASFKLTGKRIFKMAPLHHHFEKLGWSEPTVVIRFWIIASILALIGLSTLKLR